MFNTIELLKTTGSHIERDVRLLSLHRLLTTNWDKARDLIPEIESTLLELAGYPTMESFLEKVGPTVATFLIVCGQGARWKESFKTDAGEAAAAQFGLTDPNKSRFLTQVPNLLPHELVPNRTIPILSYNFYGIREIITNPRGFPLGKNFTIYGKAGDEPEIRRAAATVGMHTELRLGHGSPGHGGNLYEYREELKGFEYAITLFGNDVTSTRTVKLSLLTLHVLRMLGEPVSLVLPTARMETPKYPVFINKEGIPEGFGQAKLWGEKSMQATDEHLTPAGSNVGIRVYAARDLFQALVAYKQTAPSTGEFALDGVDSYLTASQRSQRGGVVQLCTANEAEILHSAKKIDELPFYMEMLRQVLEENIA